MPAESDILVVIPAFNAADTLPELIDRCRRAAPHLPLAVVNDGSQDSTGDVLAGLDVIALSHSHNRGKGEALKTGFDFARDEGYDCVITLDADLQHAPESIPSFVEAYRTGAFDIIIGTRTIALSVMPLDRWWTNKTTSWIISKMTRQQVTDSQSGYRLISTAVWHAVPLATTNYDLESEILIRAGKMGYRIGEVPIETIYTGGKSYINPLVDTGRFIKLVWRNLGWKPTSGRRA